MLKHQIKTTVIRKELNTFSFNDRIWNNRCKWKYYTERMELEYVFKQLTNYVPRRTRSIGCSELCWKDQPTQHRNRMNQKVQTPMMLMMVMMMTKIYLK
jgi:hypothetical protein